MADLLVVSLVLRTEETFSSRGGKAGVRLCVRKIGLRGGKGGKTGTG